MFQKVNTLTNIAKNLVIKHGSEVGTVAKIAAHALIPGAQIVEVVGMAPPMYVA